MDHYIGLDVSLYKTHVCLIDEDGTIVLEKTVLSDPDSLDAVLSSLSQIVLLIGLEAGQLSSCLCEGLIARGHPVVCIESRHMNTALKAQRVKTDRNDARGIAQMMRMGWYRKVHIKSPLHQRFRVLLQNRRWLLGRKVDLTNQVRGTLRSFGFKIGRVGWKAFDTRVHELLVNDEELLHLVLPMLRARAALIKEIEELDKRIRHIVRDNMVCRRLMTIPGIGPINALAFVSAIDNPHLFRRSRDVGAFLGLTPSKYASGEIDRNGSITKCGDALARTYLYEAANTLLTRLRRPCTLRTWGLELAQRSSNRKARVALARKLATIMHRIWVDGTEFKWTTDDARTVS